MKAILYVIAILLAGAGAYFSYDYDNKFKGLEQQFDETSKMNEKAKNGAKTAQKSIDEAAAQLTAATEQKTLLEQKISTLNAAASKLKSDATKAERELKAQDMEMNELNSALEEVKQILGGLGPEITLETLPDKIKQFENEIAADQKKLEEMKTLMATTDAGIAEKRAELDRLAKQQDQRNTRIKLNSMSAVISAVDQDHGFVVIGAGANSGFTPQTALIVERDGRSIARVKPSSVEPTQTIADIDRESVASGVRIQPGDRVILEKPFAN